MAPTTGGVVQAAPAASLHAAGSADPADFPVPGGREEEWRFTPLRRLRGLHKDAPLDGESVTVSWQAPPEVEVRRGPREAAPAGSTFLPASRVSARANAAAREAVTVSVPKEAEASAPVYLRVTGSGGEQASAGHLVIELAPLSRATVVIDCRGSASYADNVEVIVGDGAGLELVWIAGWDDDAVQVSAQHATLGRDSRYKHVAVTTGGSLVRLSPSVRYTAPGGDAELYGICFADAGQHLEHRLFIDHDVPSCRSLVRYKGALTGDGAHTVWIGDVLIRPEATGTDTYEYNRNLVLTDGAHADSVPNLEILTGEVAGAGHASANGKLEEEHLFYLMARGIPHEEARRLVIRGFFGELIAKISVPELREQIAAVIEAELGEGTTA